jgi:DNA-binding transcriptional ArsR family regulator
MHAHDRSNVAILDWLAAIGAGSAGELAASCGLSLRATSARLRAMEDAGLTRSLRLLHGAPALHALTRRGLRAAGRPELDPVAVSASGFAHLLAVARVAVALGDAGHRVGGERELRAWERAEGRPLASGRSASRVTGRSRCTVRISSAGEQDRRSRSRSS